MWTKFNNSCGLRAFTSLIILGLLPSSLCITIGTYDKPIETSAIQISRTARNNNYNHETFNITLPMNERQKRLLPYMNYYVQQSFNQNNQPNYQKPQRYQVVFPKNQIHNQPQADLNGINYYQPGNQPTKGQLTPFTESNALPGPFIPMSVNNQQRDQEEYATITRQPNLNDIYEKLSQLNFQEQRQQSGYNENYDKQDPAVQQLADARKTLIRYLVPLQDGQKIMPSKPIIQTYTATQVDIPPSPQYHQDVKEQVRYSGRPIEFPQNTQDEQKTPINQGAVKPVIVIEQRVPSYKDAEKQKMFEEQLQIYEDQQKIYYQQQRIQEEERKKYEPQSNYHQYVAIQEPQQNNYAPQIVIQKLPSTSVNPQPRYPAYNPEYKTIIDPPSQNAPPAYGSRYNKPQHQSLASENPNLGYILRRLQETNALPQNLTPENIDNSIKTLMKILNALKKHQRLSKRPIVVPDLPEKDENNQVVTHHVHNVPGTLIQNFPENTPEGGTPGTPGVDYPALSTIPKTSFNCKTQRYKGFFGDTDTNCQVWHYCDFNGGQASFLCPNGTIFSQVALTCDWWYNVKCSTTPQLYVLNERLYKYILPFSPKFPEDYSGPLVDRYLALKFQEMEEKMQKERKKNKEQSEEKPESTAQTEKVEIDDAEQLRIKNQELDMNSDEDRSGIEEEEDEEYKQK